MSVLTAVSDIKQSIVQNRQGHHGRRARREEEAISRSPATVFRFSVGMKLL